MEPGTNARQMRNNPTDAEVVLWRALSARKVGGARFNRQVRIKPSNYICDLVARTPRLVIEIDGSQHALRTEEDAARTRYLESRGYKVIRFWNNEVLGNLDGVVAEIERVLAALPSQRQVKQPPAVSARPGDERPDAPSRKREESARSRRSPQSLPSRRVGGAGGGHVPRDQDQ